jgi:hypothetical protein
VRQLNINIPINQESVKPSIRLTIVESFSNKVSPDNMVKRLFNFGGNLKPSIQHLFRKHCGHNEKKNNNLTMAERSFFHWHLSSSYQISQSFQQQFAVAFSTRFTIIVQGPHFNTMCHEMPQHVCQAIPAWRAGKLIT